VTLPAPHLDDRRFQDLVDDAKRMVQRKWPEWTGWTDHNVSDPGVTLIETVAFVVDQMLYRLNRVPDRNYVKFLELIGLQLQPPTAAIAPVTFWLSARQDADVTVPQGTEVATERTDTQEPIVFRTMSPLTIVATWRTGVASAPVGAPPLDLTDPVDAGAEVPLFSPRPATGDAFYVGLSRPTPNNTVVVRFEGDVEGYGINPDYPPIEWQAQVGADWVKCEVDHDWTGGFNRSGDIVLHVPDGHRISAVAQRRAAWLRCIVTVPRPGENPYDASPRVRRLEAFTIAGTVDAIHAEEIRGEILGISEGVPGQKLQLERSPVVLAPDPEILEVVIDDVEQDGVVTAGRVEEWVRVDTFAGHGPDDRIFTIEPATGEVALPPAIREADGSVRRFGAVAPVGSVLRLRSYRTGGGRRGNVAMGALRNLRSSIPLISRVGNRVAAAGGVDGESLDEAKHRGPLMLRTRDRAVTAGDFEHHTREAAPDIARVRCIDVGASDPGGVRVLVVPRVFEGPAGVGRIRIDQLRPSDETFERIVEHLEQRRVVGVRVLVEMPAYVGVTVIARLQAKQRASITEVQQLALDALYGYYNPVTGGPDGDGWPFGRPIHAGEVHAVLQRVPGVDFVEDAQLFTYDVNTTERGSAPTDRIDVPPNGLVLSFAHEVRVGQRP
jgi:predicted phage baseplate assembly protein